MNISGRKIIGVFMVLIVLGFGTALVTDNAHAVINPPYYVTIEKVTDSTEIALPQGKTGEVKYTIIVNVNEEEPLEGCYLTLTKEDCITITDSSYGVFEEEICYANGPMEYTYTYYKEIGPYEECGDHVATNNACMEYSAIETLEQCCSGVDIQVNVPCTEDYYYVTIDKNVSETDLTLELGEFTEVEYTITIDVSEEEPAEGCYLVLERGECVSVTDTSNDLFTKTICYAKGPGIYEFTYTQKIGKYNECGEYVISNKACIEILKAQPLRMLFNYVFRLLSVTSLPDEACCAEVDVKVNVPCEEDNYYVVINKEVDYQELVLEREEIAEVEYTISVKVTDTEPSDICSLVLEPGECIRVTDSLNTEFEETICYGDDIGQYKFSYLYEIGPYDECGDYLIENRACLEKDEITTTEPCDDCGCCDLVVISVEVPCDFFCPRSKGYWKNHPGEWPVDELMIGGEIYPKGELIGMLKSPSKGDMELILIKQLIPAKLNKAAGADTNSIDGVIELADECLETGVCSRGRLEDLKDKLDRFNNSGEDCYDDDDDCDRGCDDRCCGDCGCGDCGCGCGDRCCDDCGCGDCGCDDRCCGDCGCDNDCGCGDKCCDDCGCDNSDCGCDDSCNDDCDD